MSENISKITLCGDDCLHCPRYNAKTEEELSAAAELWYRMGWRESIVSCEEIRCEGCSSHKSCTYGISECVRERSVSKCNECNEFPCEKISKMLLRSESYKEKARRVCTEEEYRALEKAFFNKEDNLKR